MVDISFATLEIFFTMLWVACRVIVWRRQGHIDWGREAVLLLMYVNLAVIIRFTFFPLSRANGSVQPLSFDPAAVFPLRVNLRPFVRLRDYAYKRDLLVNVIGNVALFIPTGIVLPIVYKELDGFWKVLAAGFAISLIIELLQLPFYVRSSDIDDLIMNVAGVAIGYGIYALVRALARPRA